MRFKSIILIDNENAKVSLELWEHHFIKQKWNTTGTFKDVFEEKYTHSKLQEGKKKSTKKKEVFLRLYGNKWIYLG